MKHKFLIVAPMLLVLMLLCVSSVAGAVPPPHTNDGNRDLGWAHVDQLSVGSGSTTLSFISTRVLQHGGSCFEYRRDGKLSDQISPTNPNPTVTDGKYPYVCVDGNITTLTVTGVDSYVEVRSQFGAESDERFGWTRFDLTSPPSTCRIVAPSLVNEGGSIPTTIECAGVNGAYGFQLGTSYSGQATPDDNEYTAGTFLSAAGTNFREQTNSLADYSVTLQRDESAVSGLFTLGSLDYTATSGLTTNGSLTLTLNPLLLGDITGAPLALVTASPAIVTVRDLLTLYLKVESDGAVQQVNNVFATVGTESRGPEAATGKSLTFNFVDKFETQHPIIAIADMKSHLECSGGSLNLLLGTPTRPSNTYVTIHLRAGDVAVADNETTPAIDLADAVAIGLQYGSTTPTGEVDVTADGKVDILDLIQFGRNYGISKGTCL